MSVFKALSLLSLCTLLFTAACGDPDDHGGDNENEVITTVGLIVTPDGGGAAQTFEFDDPDGDGGDPATIDSVDLTAGAYTVVVYFENRLEDPAEDITEEIMDEADEHQIFLTGTAVDGPATDNAGAPLMHAYDDQDTNGHPIGIASTITAIAGTGDLVVTLRHLPPVGDQPAKTAGLAADVAGGGFAAIGGSSDASVTFPVTVQ
jgi:hypothetical protein